jgi:hypothetical protein
MWPTKDQLAKNLEMATRFGATGASTRRVGHPPNTQSMQGNVVAEAEVVGIQDSLIGIPDEFVVGDTPVLVTNNAFAVLAGTVGAVAIAMGPRRARSRVHDIISGKARKNHARRLT